jgi:hypothetical protein
MAIDELSRGALNYFRWRHGGWRRMGIAEPTEPPPAPLLDPDATPSTP